MYGWDPIKFLSLTGTEWLVAKAVLEEAVDQDTKRRRDDFKTLQAVVQTGVAKALGAK